MWPSGPHLSKEVWDLGLDLAGAHYVFRDEKQCFVLVRLSFEGMPRSFAFMQSLGERAVNRPGHVLVGLGLLLDPDG